MKISAASTVIALFVTSALGQQDVAVPSASQSASGSPLPGLPTDDVAKEMEAALGTCKIL